MTDREGDPEEVVRRGIDVACAPGFPERQPQVVQELIDYRLSNPVPPAQYQAQVAAGAGTAAFSQEEVVERMGRIDLPVLILFGEEDRVVPAGNAALMEGKLPDARTEILPGAGHLFPIEAPAATVDALLDFLPPWP
jgi:pimeloyl-ACP methyl ester carboxylesterase